MKNKKSFTSNFRFIPPLIVCMMCFQETIAGKHFQQVYAVCGLSYADPVVVTIYNLYPMPANDFFYLNYESTGEIVIQISVVDASGKKVSDDTISILEGEHIITFDARTLGSGVYYMIFSYAGAREEQLKFLIAHN